MTSIVLVSGSIRTGSLNTAAIAAVGRVITRRCPSARLASLNIRAMPHYDAELDAGGAPAAVAHARALAGSADALVISTPSYNGAMPGVLKNALDWLSRPWGDSALTGQPVVTMSVSPGPRGGVDAQPGLRSVLEVSGAVVIGHPTVALGNAESLAAAGFAAPAVLAGLEGLVDALLAHLARTPERSAA